MREEANTAPQGARRVACCNARTRKGKLCTEPGDEKPRPLPFARRRREPENRTQLRPATRKPVRHDAREVYDGGNGGTRAGAADDELGEGSAEGDGGRGAGGLEFEAQYP